MGLKLSVFSSVISEIFALNETAQETFPPCPVPTLSHPNLQLYNKRYQKSLVQLCCKKKKRKHLRYDASRNVNARIGATDAELYTLDVRYLYY